MKHINIFKVLLMISITHGSVYSMMRIPGICLTKGCIRGNLWLSNNLGMFKPTSIRLMSWNHQEDPEKLLNIGSRGNITEAELKSAYKKMAMVHHPDQGGKQADFIKLQDAYEYLMHLLKTGKLNTKTNSQDSTPSSSTTNERVYYQTAYYQTPDGTWKCDNPHYDPYYRRW